MMAVSTGPKRLVYHFGGYDPFGPPDVAYSRFKREIRRFERTWSVTSHVSPAQLTNDEGRWSIITQGTNWQVETEFRLFRWDDVIANLGCQPLWRRLPLGIVSFLDFVLAGALLGYLRTNWFYAVFFLYPFLMFASFMAIAVIIGVMFAERASGIAGISAGCIAFAALMLGPWRWLHLAPLFDDWIFARAYIRYGDETLERRLDRIATEIGATARRSEADEIVFVGHSLGAVLAIDLIDRILTLSPSFGQIGPRVAFLSIGSSVLKIGLHRDAKRFRAAVQKVAIASGIFWGDFQARVDIMNFYNIQPMAEMGLVAMARPVVRLVEIGRTLEHTMYRRMRLKFFRLHCQFISGNDRRAPYDYFMLVCGPLSAESQTLSDDGAMSMMGEDGSLDDLREQPVGSTSRGSRL
jgi:hypothetical protein